MRACGICHSVTSLCFQSNQKNHSLKRFLSRHLQSVTRERVGNGNEEKANKACESLGNEVMHVIGDCFFELCNPERRDLESP